MMNIKLPLTVLGYDEKRLFMVENDDGNTILPVFSEIEDAEKYRKHFTDNGVDLQTLILIEPEKAVNLFEVVMLISSLEFIVINPPPPQKGQKMVCHQTWEFLRWVKDSLLPNNQVFQTDGNPHHPQTQKDRPMDESD
jgi:hypothetical protein